MILGRGSFRYEVVPGWARWAPEMAAGVVSAVAADSSDRVYLMVREPNPVVHVFAADGEPLRSWSSDRFRKPHSIWIGPDDEVLIADVIQSCVFRFSLAGELLEEIAAGPSGRFHKPTWAVRERGGDLLVAGGYGQDCIHRLSSHAGSGLTWGQTGRGPGEFSTPHGIRVDSAGRVFVADRGNSRIQRFGARGELLGEWGFLGPANDLFIDSRDHLFVAECDRRITILDPDGAIVAQLHDDQIFADYFHGIWVDSRRDIYVCEVKTRPCRVHKLVRA
jgi:hypothetical protein